MNYKILMCEDWIRYKSDFSDKELAGKVAIVEGIHGRIDVRTKDGVYHESEHPDWFEPIPLTLEIFENSGFRKYSSAEYEIFEDVMWYHGSLYVYDKNKTLLDIPECFYVHQLQHILRSCNDERKIVV